MHLTPAQPRTCRTRLAGAVAVAFAIALSIPAGAALAQGQAGAAPVQRLLATDPASGTQVWATETAEALELRTRGNTVTYIGYHIDRDANGAFDPDVDANYGSNQDSPCAQRVMKGGWSACGGLATAGTFSRLQVGDLMVTKWVIPRRELIVQGDTFGMTIEFVDRNTGQPQSAHLYYRFGVGTVPGPALRQAGQAFPANAEALTRYGRSFDAVFGETAFDTVVGEGIVKLGTVRTTGCRTDVQAAGKRWTLDWSRAEPLDSSNDVLAIDAGGYVVLSAYQRQDLIARLIDAGQMLRALCAAK